MMNSNLKDNILSDEEMENVIGGASSNKIGPGLTKYEFNDGRIWVIDTSSEIRHIYTFLNSDEFENSIFS